jgi:hypothetical protein
MARSAAGAAVEDGRISAVITESKSGREAVAVKSVVDCTGDADICRLSGAKTALYAPKNALASWYYFYSKGQVRLNMFGLADIVPEEGGVNAGKIEAIFYSALRWNGGAGTFPNGR